MITPSSFSNTPEASRFKTERTNHYTTANPDSLHDAELVRRFNYGDEDAFIEIVSRHRRKMFAIAFGHLRNHSDAEEIAQDTCIHAYRGLARFRGESSLASWLYRIAFNLSRNRCGYFSRRYRHQTSSFDSKLSDESELTLANLVANDTPDPAREETNREFLAHVGECMTKLTVRQREILRLRNTLGQSYEEIAVALNISPGTVKSRIARAREHLRELLASIYGESEPGTSISFKWFDRNRYPSLHSIARS
jgi:RNA polymerase sigma-70 factor (ECF subfamily)